MEDRRLILISRIVERTRREEIARHEFLHCWKFHVPATADEEAMAQFSAFVGMQFDRDLEAQGGREALIDLVPEHVPHLGKPVNIKQVPLSSENALGSTDRMTCGGCGSETICGSIDHGEAAAAASGRFWVQRWFRCEQCGALQIWWQYCRSTGELMGEIVSIPAPKLLRGMDASRWLLEHAGMPVA